MSSECPLLHRIDERTTLMLEKVSMLREEVHDLRSHVRENYVTREEFLPLRNTIYRLAGAVLITVLGALLTVLLKV